ncbi:hypothetical protein O3M35_008912 [Rhynocoris fuscipes]|uniref:Uncharacterized protein n=1 Tax=Rhynocoris fuscipes TaxID=488301 RepID=A0AAW1D7W4_9HEMI
MRSELAIKNGLCEDGKEVGMMMVRLDCKMKRADKEEGSVKQAIVWSKAHISIVTMCFKLTLNLVHVLIFPVGLKILENKKEKEEVEECNVEMVIWRYRVKGEDTAGPARVVRRK